MSYAAITFAQGYRDGRIEIEGRAGVEHLVAGQYEAIWADDERKVIELSYAHALGHAFIVMLLDPDTLAILRTVTVNVHGMTERPAPEGFELSEGMLAAIAKLKSDVAVT